MPPRAPNISCRWACITTISICGSRGIIAGTRSRWGRSATSSATGKTAATRRGLRFGVSEHLGASYNWWYPSHLYDQFWPKLGVDYDGADPRYRRSLPHNRDEPFLNKPRQLVHQRTRLSQRCGSTRIRDLVDSYQPDLLYSDGGLPFGDDRAIAGRASLQQQHRPRTASSTRSITARTRARASSTRKGCVQDVERGVLEGINPLPWQTDTSNGDWFYNDERQVQDAAAGHRDAGRHRQQERQPAAQRRAARRRQPAAAIGDSCSPNSPPWMAVNAEAIHGTRPWKIHGEGPTEAAAGSFKEDGGLYRAATSASRPRASTLYAITLGEPAGATAIKALAQGNPHEPRRVRQRAAARPSAARSASARPARRW